MFADFWFSSLYQPLLNFLVYLYNTFAGGNMGWAVIILTIILRFVLLPFSIVSQRNEINRERAEAAAAAATLAFKNDSVAQKEEYRRIMRRHHLSPWAKVIVLGVQGLVLVLLYQVFMGGIFGERLIKTLYVGVSFPGLINNIFYGHNLSQIHSLLWPFIAAVYLFVSILVGKGRWSGWEKSEFVFLFLFPLFTFTVFCFADCIFPALNCFKKRLNAQGYAFRI